MEVIREIPGVKNISNMIENHKKNIQRKTLTVKELAQVLGTSENKARQLTHSKGFPVLVLGHTRLTLISQLDAWLEDNIGEIF